MRLFIVLMLLGGVVKADPRYERAKKMRTAGIALSATGAALVIIGTVLFLESGAGCSSDTDPFQGCDSGWQKMVAGFSLIGVGAASFGTGVVLWPLGQVRMSRMHLSLGPPPRGSLGGGGIVLSW
jgi:hypothetical protein